jgi:hypothetical protein
MLSSLLRSPNRHTRGHTIQSPGCLSQLNGQDLLHSPPTDSLPLLSAGSGCFPVLLKTNDNDCPSAHKHAPRCGLATHKNARARHHLENQPVFVSLRVTKCLIVEGVRATGFCQLQIPLQNPLPKPISPNCGKINLSRIPHNAILRGWDTLMIP